MAEMTLAITADTTHLTHTARIIARHMTALADELEGVQAKAEPDPLDAVGRTTLKVRSDQ